MKKIFHLLACIMLAHSIHAQVILEAENAVLDSDLSIGNSATGYTGSGYVGYFQNGSDSVLFTYNVPETGEYYIKFRSDRSSTHELEYKIDYGSKTKVTVPSGSGFRYSDSIHVYLSAGKHAFTALGYWGYLNLDHMVITKYTPVPYDYSQVSATLVNQSKATQEAKELYNYLRSLYGKKIISGYTGQSSGDQYWRQARTAGAASLMYDIDMCSLSEGYSYKWSNALGTQIFGSVDNHQIDSAIARHKAGNIITAQWHWYVPSGAHGPDVKTGARGEVSKTPTFSTSTTNYDIRKAVDPTTEEYAWLIQDIDQVSVHMKRLLDAKVPVLWRPLHEAAGGWFWWGTDKDAFIKLWSIMYDRMVNYHGLYNLIWVLGQAYPEKGWLVNPNEFDIIGFDNYPGAYNYAEQKTRIELLREQVNHKKLVAVTETGPIPDPDLSFSRDAMYSYFVGWASESLDQFNTADHFKSVYSNDLVLVLGDTVVIPPVDPPVDTLDPVDPPVDPVDPPVDTTTTVDPVDPPVDTTTTVDPVDPPVDTTTTVDPVDPPVDTTTTVDPVDPPIVDNSLPVVNINYTENLKSGKQYTLDASESYDPDNEPLSYLWDVPQEISTSSKSKPVINILASKKATANAYTVNLFVSDGKNTVKKSITIGVVDYNMTVQELKVMSIEASDYQDNYYPENILDNNAETRWSANGDNQWLELELIQESSISYIELSFYQGDSRTAYFDIFASNDRENWDLILENSTSCGYSPYMHAFDFPQEKTSNTYKYVKIVGHMNSKNTWNSFNEIKIYGVLNPNQLSSNNRVKMEDIIEVYPNPVSEQLYVNLAEASNIKVVDMSGKVYYNKDYPEGTAEINIGGQMEPGTYLIQVSTVNSGQIFTNTLVIQ